MNERLTPQYLSVLRLLTSIEAHVQLLRETTGDELEPRIAELETLVRDMRATIVGTRPA